ncbi:MAG TPA: Gfo/Idh/MocA family oxidoreductase [Polyangiaceae bacterium]
MGLGSMGRRHARVLASLPGRFTVVGAYDVSAPGAPAAVRVFDSEAEAIAAADVVVVATPIHAHASTVGRALASGRHVLVEKPLCARAADADALVAAEGRARVFVGHSERFNPVVRALGRLLKGERVLAIDLVRVGPSRPSDCGVLLNLAVHDLDLAAYLGGHDLTLHDAIGASTSRGSGEDVAHMLLTTSTGMLAHLHVDRTVPHRRRELVLQTTRWIFEGDLLAHRLTRTCRATGTRTDVPLPIEEPLLGQALAMADALDGAAGREIATVADGARAVRLAERAAAYCTSTAPVAQPVAFAALPR